MSDPAPRLTPPGALRLTIAAIVDAVNMSVEGKLNLTGIFDTIHSDSEPVTWPRMFFVVRFDVPATIVGRLVFETRIVSPDGALVMAPMRGAADVPPATTPYARTLPVMVDVRDCTLPSFGDYSVELWEIAADEQRQLACVPLRFRHRTAGP